MRSLPVAALCIAFPAVLSAQVPGGSARALGMGGAYGALARGYETPGWNPALLGISHQPHFSIGLPTAQVEFNNNAYTFGDLTTYADSNLTDADKQYLLSRIVNDDSTLALQVDVGLAPLGVQVGRFAVTLSQSAFATGAVPHDAVEFALYGNWTAGTNVLQLAGTGGHGWAATTLAGSYGYPLHILGHSGAIGVTIKRVWGNFLGQMSNTLSSVSVDSVHVDASTIYTNYGSGESINSVGDLFGRAPATGTGVDLGAAIELSDRHITLSAAMMNVFGGMKWQTDRLRYTNSVYTLYTTPGGTVADTSGFVALTDPTAIQNDPKARALRDSLLGTTDFARLLRLSGAWRTGKLTAASDVQLQLSHGLDYHPDVLWSVGAEYALLGILPVRAGFRSDFAKTTAASVGLGLRLGPVALDFSGAAILGSLHPGVITAVGLGLLF